ARPVSEVPFLPRAVLSDFYGTLVHAPGFALRRGIEVLASSLRGAGVAVEDDAFEAAHHRAALPYLQIMRGGIETHNTSWVADALVALGIPALPSDARVIRAVRRYFEAYAAAIEPLPGARDALGALLSRGVPVVL